MSFWGRYQSVIGYILVFTLVGITVAAVKSQANPAQPSAEGRLKQYSAGENQAVLGAYTQGDWGLPTAPGDNTALYPGDEKWEGQYAGGNYATGVLATDGQVIYAGTNLPSSVPSQPYNLARWENNTWGPITQGPNGIVKGGVQAIAVQNNTLYVGGSLQLVGNKPVNGIAYWDGTGWNDMGGGLTSIYGTGYASSIAIGTSGVYVGGSFNSAGGQAANNIAWWDGTSWHPLANGINGWISTIAVSGNDVYVGGYFDNIDGQPIYNIARWDGQNWYPLGGGTDARVASIAIQGNDVFVGGAFDHAGGQEISGVARWDGTNWYPVGNGLDAYIYAIKIAPEGLYAAGDFAFPSAHIQNVVLWDGNNWTNLGSGLVNGTAYDVLPLNDKVYLGGSFTKAGDNKSSGFAIWHKQPELQIMVDQQRQNLPAAPGSIIYLWGQYFPANKPVDIQINGKLMKLRPTATADGKVTVNFYTGPLNPPGDYQVTMTSGDLSTSANFTLNASLPQYLSQWLGFSMYDPGFLLHLPLTTR